MSEGETKYRDTPDFELQRSMSGRSQSRNPDNNSGRRPLGVCVMPMKRLVKMQAYLGEKAGLPLKSSPKTSPPVTGRSIRIHMRMAKPFVDVSAAEPLRKMRSHG